MPAQNLNKLVYDSIKQINTFFSNFAENMTYSKTRAMEYFRAMAKQARGGGEARDYIIRNNGKGFYFFFYESKLYNENKLPHYDAYPLILVLNVTKKGFLAINFHWIHPRYRLLIIKHIIQNHPEEFFDDKPIKINYKKLMRHLGSHKKYVNYAIRSYLWKQLKTVSGLRVSRVAPNTEIINAISYVSPQYIDISRNEANKVIKDKNNNF
jgi:hypothetical protein